MGVVKRYKDLFDTVRSGSRLLYRSKQMMREAKLAKGGISSASWHLRGEVKQTVNIPITPGAELANNLKTRISNMIGPDQGKTLVIEKGGNNLLGGIYKSDPFKKDGCRWNEECIVDSNTDFMDSNIVYKISCKQCSTNIVTDTNSDNPSTVLTDAQNQFTTTQCDILAPTAWSSTTTDCTTSTSTTTDQKRTCYIGQSGRTMHARLRNHIDGLRRGDNKCPLYKHTQMSHDGSKDSSLFIAKKLTSSRTNLHRLISESEHIQNNHSEGLMNSKSEYRGTKIIRMQTHRTIV